MRATVVAGVDAAPVFEPAEHAFDEVAAFVLVGIEGDGLRSVGPAGNAGFDAPVGQELPEPIAVISLVGDANIGIGKGGQYGRGATIIADLSLGEQQDERLAVAIANRVQL